MRSHFLTLFATVFLASISITAWSARTLEITTPNGGEELVKAKKYFIEWNNTGYGKNLKVKLELLKAGKKYKVIKKKTTNDGKYKWKVPSDVVFGKKAYQIRIRSIGPSGKSKHGHADKSDNKFSIIKK